jgi:hypothetical protein
MLPMTMPTIAPLKPTIVDDKHHDRDDEAEVAEPWVEVRSLRSARLTRIGSLTATSLPRRAPGRDEDARSRSGPRQRGCGEAEQIAQLEDCGERLGIVRGSREPRRPHLGRTGYVPTAAGRW